MRAAVTFHTPAPENTVTGATEYNVQLGCTDLCSIDQPLPQLRGFGASAHWLSIPFDQGPTAEAVDQQGFIS